MIVSSPAIGSRYPIRQLTRRGRFIHLHDTGTDDDIEALVKFRAPRLTITDKLWTIFRAVNAHELGGFGGVSNILIDAEEGTDKRNRTQRSPHRPLCKNAVRPGKRREGKNLQSVAALSALDTVNSSTPLPSSHSLPPLKNWHGRSTSPPKPRAATGDKAASGSRPFPARTFICWPSFRIQTTEKPCPGIVRIC